MGELMLPASCTTGNIQYPEVPRSNSPSVPPHRKINIIYFSFLQFFFLSAPLYSLISLLWFVIAESLTATVDFPVTWLLQKVRSGRTKRGGRVVIVGLLMGTELCCLDLHLESR